MPIQNNAIMIGGDSEASPVADSIDSEYRAWIEKRNAQEKIDRIVRRTDFVKEYLCPPGVNLISYEKARDKACKEGKFLCRYGDYPFPLQEVQILFPMTAGEEQALAAARVLRDTNYPDEAAFRKVFDKNHNRFCRSPEYQVLERTLTNIFTREDISIDKIIAFSDYSVTPADLDEDAIYKHHAQHAMLLLIQRTWSNVRSEHIKIYIQGPAYSKFDETVMASLPMEVVSDESGQQEGWTMIDESAFVVNMNTADLVISNLVFDLFAPAIFFSPRLIPEALDADEAVCGIQFALVLEFETEPVLLPSLDFGATNICVALQQGYKCYGLGVRNVLGESAALYVREYGENSEPRSKVQLTISFG